MKRSPICLLLPTLALVAFSTPAFAATPPQPLAGPVAAGDPEPDPLTPVLSSALSISGSRKAPRVEILARDLGATGPEALASLLSADGSAAADLGATLERRRRVGRDGFEVLALQLASPASRPAEGSYLLRIAVTDLASGRPVTSTTAVRVNAKGFISAYFPEYDPSFWDLNSNAVRRAGNWRYGMPTELWNGGYIVWDGTDAYVAYRPGSSANPVEF